MPPVPVIGRLSLHEYTALLASVSLLLAETLLRFIVLLLPKLVIRWFYDRSRTLFHRFSPRVRPRSAEQTLVDAIRTARDFGELCALWGYTYEEHVVLTKDGYLLGLHRLKGRATARTETSTGKSVVYLHHGLLMNSEVWVCLTDESRCIPFVLVEQGFDVWLGNNRGNKYSRKSVNHSPNSRKFWDYCLDDFAWHDIPETIEYILHTTEAASLGYVGFSQGTAQAFAALSIHPQLNEKVNVFVALAPAMSPTGLSAPVVDALMKSSPMSLYLFFGRKAILSSVPTWQSILYPPIFTQIIDTALSFLFDWRSHNISYAQKLAAYAHLYSYASVKSVVHWFQIMREATFQMYDDDLGSGWGILQTHGQSSLTGRSNGADGRADSYTPTHLPISLPVLIQEQKQGVDSPDSTSSPASARTLLASQGPRQPGHTRLRSYRPVRFPTRNIRTPIVLLYGTADSLVDIDAMLVELPQHSTSVVALEGYEHLDILWGSNIHVDVVPEVVGALRSWCGNGDSRGSEGDGRSAEGGEGVKVSQRPSSR